MSQLKLNPKIVFAIFSLLTAFLLVQHFDWAGSGRAADIIILPMGILSGVFAWYTFRMQYAPSWKRGILVGILAAVVGSVLMTSLLLRSGDILDSSFVSDFFDIIFISLLFNGLKFTLPVIALGATAGFLSNNYIQYQEASK